MHEGRSIPLFLHRKRVGYLPQASCFDSVAWSTCSALVRTLNVLPLAGGVCPDRAFGYLIPNATEQWQQEFISGRQIAKVFVKTIT